MTRKRKYANGRDRQGRPYGWYRWGNSTNQYQQPPSVGYNAPPDEALEAFLSYGIPPEYHQAVLDDPHARDLIFALLDGDEGAGGALEDRLKELGYEEPRRMGAMASGAKNQIDAARRQGNQGVSTQFDPDENPVYYPAAAHAVLGAMKQVDARRRDDALWPMRSTMPVRRNPRDQEQLSARGAGASRRDKPLKYQTPSETLSPSASNTEDDLSFDEAYQRVQSGDQRQLKQMSDQFVTQLGLKGTSYSAVGDWEDGAEQSVLTQIPQQVDMETLRYVGAWQGLTGNQHSVLVFRPEPSGLDSVYQIQVPETATDKVRAQLSRHGIPYRTIVPGRKGTKVVIYDQKRSLRHNVTQFAQSYNAPVRETVGSGDYVGGGSRSEARAKFRDVIAEYESRRPGHAGPATAGPPGGGQVPQGQADESRGRGRPPTA